MLSSLVEIKGKQFKYFYKKNNENKNVIIFLNGLNGVPNVIDNLKHPVFEENFVVTFDNIAHGSNPLKHTSSYKKFGEFAYNMIEAIRKEQIFENKKIVVIGESLGSTLCFWLKEKHINIADLFFSWNAPTKIPKTHMTFKEKFPISLKVVFSLLTGIETQSKSYFEETLTSNKAIVRIQRMQSKKLASNKANLAVWKSMYYTRKQINKNHFPKNFYYVQSKDDVMLSKKIHFNSEDKNFIFFQTGRHLLSFEKESQDMFNMLQDKIGEL